MGLNSLAMNNYAIGFFILEIKTKGFSYGCSNK